jgi:DNA primase
MSITDDIKQRLNIVDLINDNGVALRKAGRNFSGFCPFHPNTRTPAFFVFPDTQSYYCFGCHAAGDAFNFVMARQGVEFGEALQSLAERTGVQLNPEGTRRTPQQEHEDSERARLRQINNDAAAYWHHLLISTQKGQPGREYVAQRGLEPTTVETWQLGYAPDDWSDLLRYLTDRKGYQPEEIERAGLVIKREHGGYYDRFRNRLMFPIRNIKGEIVGFGGRALGSDGAKYMNTPETPLFHKSSILYGVDLAREAIKRANAVVLVEGYIDVIAAHQAGFSNVVAPMGTALTAEQVGIIKRLAKTVYLALDADAAGMQATLKGLQTLRDNLDASEVPVPTAQGYIRWERELDGVIKIITLPQGRDPDDVIRANPDEWRAMVDLAQPLMDYYLERLTSDLDVRSAKGRAEAVERLAPLIAEIGNLVERAHYIQQLSQTIGLSDQIIATAVGQARRNHRDRNAPRAPIVDVHQQAFSREDHLLSLLLRFPELAPAVEAVLGEHINQFPKIAGDLQGTVTEALAHIENQQIWQSWSKLPMEERSHPAVWLDQLDPYLQRRAERLLAYEDIPKLPVVGRQHYVAELAKKIAAELRRAVVINRCKQLVAMHQSVEGVTQRELEPRLNALLVYQNIVTAPRPNTVYADLGSRRERLV